MTMSNSPFNSVFENSLRLLILFDIFEKPQTLDMLYATDFMTIYGATFGMSKVNINGERTYKFSEFASRRELIKFAVKDLVLNGFLKPLCSSQGMVYSITEEGKHYCKKLDSDYAKEYRRVAINVIENSLRKTGRELINYINNISVNNK